jgi:hypothetical protein
MMIPGTRCVRGSWQYDGQKRNTSMAYSLDEQFVSRAPPETSHPCRPLLQGLHACDSDNKRDATLEGRDVQRCCVYLLSLMTVQLKR